MPRELPPGITGTEPEAELTRLREENERLRRGIENVRAELRMRRQGFSAVGDHMLLAIVEGLLLSESSSVRRAGGENHDGNLD